MKGLSRKGWFEGGGLWGTICPGVGAPYPRLPSYICLQDDEDDDDVCEYDDDDDINEYDDDEDIGLEDEDDDDDDVDDYDDHRN